jgi:hypothetical protein
MIPEDAHVFLGLWNILMKILNRVQLNTDAMLLDHCEGKNQNVVDRIHADFSLVRPFLYDLPFLNADLSSTFPQRTSHAFFPHSWRFGLKLRLFAPCCASLAGVLQYKKNPKS